MSTKFGVFVPQGWRMDLGEIRDPLAQYEAMTAVAREAEKAKFDSIWVYDHFHTVPTPEIETTFECWSITAGLARDTKSIKIGQMVTCNGYRNPALLAKIASTIDVMSAGRLLCGLGAGWYEHEWRAYGYGFPDVPARMRAFREAVEIVVKMWTEAKPIYQGKFYRIDEPINEPKGIQTPHIPLWLGGGGEKVTLKLVAKYAQACNVGGGDPVLVSQKLAILKAHCETLGRSYEAITKSTNITVFMLKPGEDAESATAKARGMTSLEDYKKNVVVGTADNVTAKIDSLLAAGADYIIGYLPRVAYEPERVAQYAAVIKQYA